MKSPLKIPFNALSSGVFPSTSSKSSFAPLCLVSESDACGQLNISRSGAGLLSRSRKVRCWGSLSVHVGIVAKPRVRVVVEDLDRFDLLRQALINRLDVSRGQCARLCLSRRCAGCGESCNENTCVRFMIGPSCEARGAVITNRARKHGENGVFECCTILAQYELGWLRDGYAFFREWRTTSRCLH